MENTVIVQASIGEAYHAMQRLTESWHRSLFPEAVFQIGYETKLPRIKSPLWIKIFKIEEAFHSSPDGSIILFIDSDVLILKPFNAGSLLKEGSDFGVCKHGADFINNGMMIFRNTPKMREIWDTVLKNGPIDRFPDREDMALMQVMFKRMLITYLPFNYNFYHNSGKVEGEIYAKAWHGRHKKLALREMKAVLDELQPTRHKASTL